VESRIARNTPLRQKTKRLARPLLLLSCFLHATTCDSDSLRRVSHLHPALKVPDPGRGTDLQQFSFPPLTAPVVARMRLLCLLPPSTSHVLRKRPSLQKELARLKLSSTPDVRRRRVFALLELYPNFILFPHKVCGQTHDHWLSEFKLFNSCDLVVAPRLSLFGPIAGEIELFRA
jgi:hypothetical protein